MAANWPSTVATPVQLVPLKFQMADPPTTQTSVAEIASTALSGMPVGRFVSWLHVVPLNCRICVGCWTPVPPTAKMSVLETAEMLSKLAVSSPLTDIDGAVTTLQLVPLKCSMRSASPVVPVVPTAQTSVGEMAVTDLSVPADAGVVWMLQDVPLKNSTSGDAGAVAAHGPDGVTGRGAYAVE